MTDLFQVVWADTGKLADDLYGIAIKYQDTWTKYLMYCDMEGFAIQSDGTIILCDECGKFGYPPKGLFRVEWLDKK